MFYDELPTYKRSCILTVIDCYREIFAIEFILNNSEALLFINKQNDTCNIVKVSHTPGTIKGIERYY